MLPSLAGDLGVGSIHMKDEGFRLGLGSFKALGGAYAVDSGLALEAGRRTVRPDGLSSMLTPRSRLAEHNGLLRHGRQSRPLGRGGARIFGADA